MDLRHREVKSLDRNAATRYQAAMLRRLYDWTLSLAARPTAEIWLAVIAFIESSVFLVPADVLFLPMAVARRDRAYRYAIVATVASVLGGIAGWAIGFYAYDAVAKPILDFYGKTAEFEKLAAWKDWVLLLLVTSGLAHLPPIKVVTILSGFVHVDLWLFVLSAIVARGARFLALAWLLRRYGVPIMGFIEKRLGLIAGLGAAIIIALYFVAKLLH
jgi:membrane protein YqaA with SNARE-associated domain